MLDRQKIVNFVSAKLKEQGCKSYSPFSNEDNRCKYRHGELKCAIGHIILDEEYSETLETKPMYSVYKLCPKSFEPFIVDGEASRDYSFLSELQACHDDADDRNFYQSYLSYLNIYLNMQPETV
jgi:hypothetical protein